MAEANKNTKTVVEKSYTLTLSEEEAQAILVLTGNVSGSSLTGPRKHADSVYWALSGQGVDNKFQKHYEGTARFRSNPRSY